jgi:hypothetical protein
MKTKYNYDLEIKRFLIIYLKLLSQVIILPILVILMPFLTFIDYCFKPIEEKFERSYLQELYMRYICLSNVTINL